MGVWGRGATINYCAMIHCRRDFSFSYLNFRSFDLLLTRRGCFFMHHQHNNQQKASLLFFSLLDSSSTHFVITATTTTTNTCHHHKQQPRTMPVVTSPSTTTNGKLHAHQLSECYGINGDTPDNRTAAQPQFFLVMNTRDGLG